MQWRPAAEVGVPGIHECKAVFHAQQTRYIMYDTRNVYGCCNSFVVGLYCCLLPGCEFRRFHFIFAR